MYYVNIRCVRACNQTRHAAPDTLKTSHPQFFGELREHLRREGAGQVGQPLGVRQANRRRGPSIRLSCKGCGERVGRDHENRRHEGALPSGTVSVEGAERIPVLWSCIELVVFACLSSSTLGGSRGDVKRRREVFFSCCNCCCCFCCRCCCCERVCFALVGSCRLTLLQACKMYWKPLPR